MYKYVHCRKIYNLSVLVLEQVDTRVFGEFLSTGNVCCVYLAMSKSYKQLPNYFGRSRRV